MANPPVYQIAFQFLFNQNFDNQKVLIDIQDSNSFLMNDNYTAQLAAYASNSTPPLLNFSLSGKQLYFNIDQGLIREGMQAVVWSSFSAGTQPSLQLNAQFQGGLITASYSVQGTGTSGVLAYGANTIKVG